MIIMTHVSIESSYFMLMLAYDSYYVYINVLIIKEINLFYPRAAISKIQKQKKAQSLVRKKKKQNDRGMGTDSIYPLLIRDLTDGKKQMYPLMECYLQKFYSCHIWQPQKNEL